VVERDQRLLYRFRHSLSVVVSDCPGLEEEIKRQHGDDKRSLKRRLEEPVSPVKIEPNLVEFSHINNKSQKRTKDASPGGSHSASTDTLGASKQTAISISDTEGAAPPAPICKSGKGKGRNKSEASVTTKDPFIELPCDREWPKDWSVTEIMDGMSKIDNDDRSNRIIFSETFGQRYKKSTYFDTRKVLNAAPSKLKLRFQGYGKTSQGLWPKFVAARRRGEDTDLTSDEEYTVSDAEKNLNKCFLKPTADDSQSNPVPSVSEAPLKAVCPYCENEWPSKPSTKLQELRDQMDLEINSTPEPSGTCEYARQPCLRNPAAFQLMAELCQQHIFELQLEGGDDIAQWPRDIDFSLLPCRVKSFADELSELIFDPEASGIFQTCVAEFRERNSHRVRGINGQYGLFDVIHAG